MNLEVDEMILEHAKKILEQIKLRKRVAYKNWLYDENMTNEEIKKLNEHIDYLHATEKFWTRLSENLTTNLIELNNIEKKAK